MFIRRWIIAVANGSKMAVHRHYRWCCCAPAGGARTTFHGTRNRISLVLVWSAIDERYYSKVISQVGVGRSEVMWSLKIEGEKEKLGSSKGCAQAAKGSPCNSANSYPNQNGNDIVVLR